jgi:hypothetical protein
MVRTMINEAGKRRVKGWRPGKDVRKNVHPARGASSRPRAKREEATGLEEGYRGPEQILETVETEN